MVQVHTYLSREDFERLSQICKAERCTPYILAKMATLDKIHSYALKEKSSSPKEEGMKKTEEIGKVGIPQKTPDEMARGIAEAVKQFL